MSSSRFLPRSFFAVLAVAALPVVLILGALAANGAIAAEPAAVAGAGIIAGLGLLIRRHLAQLEIVAAYLDGLAGDEEDSGAVPPRPGGIVPPSTTELSRAVADAGRAWAQRRRQLEAVVAANEAVLASLPDPLLMLDSERRIVRANQAAEAALGMTLAERDLFAVIRNPAVTEAVEEALETRQGRIVEFSLPVPVERNFSARVEPLPTPIEDGTVALLTLHDLTRMKRADQLRADFVANASHELRTPLSTLSGFIETLRGPARDDVASRDRFLAIMQEQAARMSRLVADLLSLSRIELNEHTPPTGRVEIDKVIRGVVDTLQFKAAEKNMTIRLDALPPDGGAAMPLAGLPPVSGDADELAQVFQNLVDNAIKYGRPGSIIRVAGWPVRPDASGVGPGGLPLPRRLDRPGIAIAVSDEGDGIAREHLPRLTERFYRVDTARSRDLGGTGLGLAIVKHIVNRHRGALEVDSVRDEGSSFTVYLPLAATGG